MMLQRIKMVAWKECIHILRDIRSLAVVIVLPILMVVLYGYAINTDVRHLPLAVIDLDRTASSRDLTGAFLHGEYFDMVTYSGDYKGLDAVMDRGIAVIALVIPAGYSQDIAAGRQAQIQVIADGSDSTTATIAIAYATATVQQQSAGLAVAAVLRRGAGTGIAPPVEVRQRFWYNPELKSVNFIVPGLIAVILMMLSALLTSMTVVRERERGTIEQLIVSPVMPSELIIGKLIPYILISFLDVILVIAAGRLIFNVPLNGSPGLVLALSAVFLTASLGIGLLISVSSGSQQTAMTVAMMATMLPSVLLSGFVFPIKAMPAAIQWLTSIIPARYFLTIIRSIFLKGMGIGQLWQPVLFLLLFGAGILWLSSLRFRKKL
ncbi:MAG: ABC transporter permease [bacterium]|nr:ABC transporter permease [bacterium]